MALAVVNYPAISKKDSHWIELIRKEHDNLFYGIVNHHFTLVFPTEKLDPDMLINHVKSVVRSFDSFDFTIRCATVGDPDFMDHAHVFLIPDEGFSNIVKLHDALYRGPLESELRLDLPFIPHIGIASHPNPEYCKKLVDKLNAQKFELQGRVEKLDVIEYDGKSINTVDRIIL